MEMLPYVFEQATGLKWKDENEEIKKVWVIAWNASLKAVNQQLIHLSYEGEDNNE